MIRSAIECLEQGKKAGMASIYQEMVMTAIILDYILLIRSTIFVLR